MPILLSPFSSYICLEDWVTILTLHDPSKYDRNVGLWLNDGLPLNCFSRYEQWLPQVEPGDIAVFQGMKVNMLCFHLNCTFLDGSQCQSFNYGISAVGYKDRLKWALYDSSKDTFCHPVAKGTPESEGLAGSFGYPFSPFAYPGPRELEYCRHLSSWWAKVKEKEEIRLANTTVHQIGGLDQVGAVAGMRERPRRQHRLICDAGPEIPPKGFFDCTVEVSVGTA